MSTSDRVCPTHGDVGALPNHNNCPQCGAQLEMKGILRSTAESIIPGVVMGAAIGTGLSLGDHLGDAIADGLSGITDMC